MQVLFGYTVLREKDVTDDKPWAIVRVDVRYEENPGKASQYIEVVDYHESRNMAVYWATQLSIGAKTEDECKAEIAARGAS